MQTKTQLSFFTLLLMISFASVNAVLFTPALPAIATFFAITEGVAQQTVTWFLVGYALCQLMYGPLANRFGRKPALYFGIGLQILSSLICVFAGTVHDYHLFLIGRFLLALGSGVGLKMTFTLVNETQEVKQAGHTLSYLIMAFAITPGLSVMLGGFLNAHFGWSSTFYACAVYGLILLTFVIRLPETKKIVDKDALKLGHLYTAYVTQFRNLQLIAGGLLMGCAACFVYVFAALAPFVAMNILHMTSENYGIANLVPSIGLLLGSAISAQLTKHWQLSSIIILGICIASVGSLSMLIMANLHASALLTLFIPVMICYFGLAMVLSNTSAVAMSRVIDKSHGAAVMSFINMGTATVVVISLSLFVTKLLLMPILFIVINGIMFVLLKCVVRSQRV